MKTPREILLARHQAAGPKLDAIRKATLSAPREWQTANQAERRGGRQDDWPRLLRWLPCRGTSLSFPVAGFGPAWPWFGR